MATKIITTKPSGLKDEAQYLKYFKNKTYGKPSKPRCTEPSMFQILSWKDGQQEQQRQQAHQQQQVRQSNYTVVQHPNSMKKIIHCKSLPADQFIRSKNLSNLPYDQNTQLNNGTNKQVIQSSKKVNISDYTDYSQNQNKKSISLKKITNSTKCIETSAKKLKIGDTQKEINQQFRKSNLSDNKDKNKPKVNKLQKRSIPTFVDPQNKPRYMQQKKSAVQKLIQSPQFDQQKFQKMKQDQIKRFKQTTRDLSNSAFLTYFNKPPFQNYGRQNKNAQGVLYGDYMYSHNIFPHTGQNNPQKQQTYITALSRAKSAGNIRPHPPLSRHLEQKLITGYLTLSQIYPKNTSIQSIPIKNQTVLQNLPLFNYSKLDDDNRPKYSPYLNANDNEELFTVQNQYLNKDQIPKYFSNKDEIQGKQISYTRKIQPCKKFK